MQASTERSILNGSRWAILVTAGVLGMAGCEGKQTGLPQSEAQTESSDYAFSTCTPGNRAVCSWLGACNAAGKACVCDDPQHWLSSDNCSVWHANPPLQPGQVCSPGDPAYCNQMGTCNSTGSACVCTDPQHWWSSERCLTWHAGPQSSVTTCPAIIYLANNTVTADGLHGNGGFPGFLLSTSQTTPAGLTCTYARPPQPNWEAFIGRDLVTGEVSATLASADSFLVTLSTGATKTVTCPASLTLGPSTYYRMSDTSELQSIPATWAVTQGNTQAVPFAFATTRVYVMECDYSGFTNLSVNIPLP